MLQFFLSSDLKKYVSYKRNFLSLVFTITSLLGKWSNVAFRACRIPVVLYKLHLSQGMLLHTFNASTQEAKVGESETSLVYIVKTPGAPARLETLC